MRVNASDSPASSAAAASVALLREPRRRPIPCPRPVRWRLALQLVAAGALAMLLTESVVVIPDGSAGVRVEVLVKEALRHAS